MPLRITALYAALLTLLFLGLTWRVIAFRRARRVDMGSRGDPLLERYIRAHGNFAEYAPLSLILLGTLDLGGWPAWLLHLLGLTILGGRLAHAWSFSVAELREPSRVVGMALSITALSVMVVLCLGQAILGATL